MALRIVNAAEVRQLLPMSDCIDVMDRAMRETSARSMAIPPRTIAPLFDNSGYLGVMPGSMSNPAVYGAKVISLHALNPAQGLPPIQGFVTLFEHLTGTPIAIIEGGELTAIRTAAASGLATRELARGDASSHGIFGTGVQAVSHIDAIACVRKISTVLVWNRDSAKSREFAARQAERTGLSIAATEDPAETAACDIVSTVTSSAEAVLKGEWLSPGSHVNLVGAHTPTTREADSDAIARSTIYVDFIESALNEAGDLLIPINEGRISESDIVGEIGQELTGEIAGRSDDEQITLYKSLGFVGQDLYAAEYVLRAATAMRIGKLVDLE